MAQQGDARLSARLQTLFAEELEDQLERLTSGLEAMTVAHPAMPAEVITDLFRCAHSLKGAAQAAGAPAIASLCHDLEEELEQLRQGHQTLDGRTLKKLDRLVDAVAKERDRRELSTRPGPTAGDAETTPTGAAAGGPGPVAAPADSRGPSEPRTPRIAGHKIDELTAQAGDLLTLSYASQAFLGRLAQVESGIREELAHRRAERDRILRLLAGHPERGRVASVLQDGEDRARGTARLVDEVMARVPTQSKSLRAGAADFAEAVRKVRMVPFEHATSGLRRQVQKLSGELGKPAELEITATDVEVDRELVLMLRDALGHLVRNAVDHGLEPPDERRRAGKDPRGRILVAAALRSDGIQVEVSDDGRGVDDSRLQKAADDQQLVRQDGGRLSAAEAMFAPGVSTATSVTSVSGRGMGLDAVRAAVESTGGSVTVRSRHGVGTTLTLSLPLNLSTIRVLLVRSGGQLMCLPSGSVRRLLPLPDSGRRLGPGAVVTVDEEVVPTALLSDLLGWQPPSTRPSAGHIGILAPSDAGLAILAVDEVVAEREIVLRTAPPRLAGVRMILGTAQLDDSSLVMVLNPQVCLRAVVLSPGAARTDATQDAVGGHTVLLAEDSMTTRELERSLLEAAGYVVLLAHDGQEAWEILQSSEVDAVVSDVNMPRRNGIELCRDIRSSSRLGSLPIVLVTSLHSDADRRAGLDAGADAYLTKVGFNRDDLVETLERLL